MLRANIPCKLLKYILDRDFKAFISKRVIKFFCCELDVEVSYRSLQQVACIASSPKPPKVLVLVKLNYITEMGRSFVK